jgi:excisionase family DNA binding protein
VPGGAATPPGTCIGPLETQMLDNRSSTPPSTPLPQPTHPAPLPRPEKRFLSVGAVARDLCMSEATLYRAIRSGEFPAVRVRNRYVIPVKILDALEHAALTSGGTVDAADWVTGQGVA